MDAVRIYLLSLAWGGVWLAVIAAALGDAFAVFACLTGAAAPFLLWHALRAIDLFQASTESDDHARHD